MSRPLKVRRTHTLGLVVLHAAAATAEGVGAGAVSARHRVANHTGHSLLETQGVDLALHVGHAVAGDRVQNLLSLRGSVRIDGGGVHGGVVVDAVNRPQGVAATLVLLREQVGLADSQTGHIALKLAVLVADVADHIVVDLIGGSHALRSTGSHGGQDVASLSLNVLRVKAPLDFVARRKVLIAERGGGVIALPKTTVEHAHENQQTEDPDKGASTEAAVPAITTGHQSDIGSGKSTIFHRVFSFLQRLCKASLCTGLP